MLVSVGLFLSQVRLEKGLYAIFLADWFRVFPRKQIHVIKFEDYIADIAGHLQTMFEFLDLGKSFLPYLRNLRRSVAQRVRHDTRSCPCELISNVGECGFESRPGRWIFFSNM